MRIMRIGMQEADGDGARLALALSSAGELRYRRLVQRHQHIAIDRKPFTNRVAPGARHQRCRPVDHQVVMIEALFVARLDHVAKALCGDEGGPGALALDQRIGGKRRAVDEDVDIGRADLGLLKHHLDAFKHAEFRGLPSSSGPCSCGAGRGFPAQCR